MSERRMVRLPDEYYQNLLPGGRIRVLKSPLYALGGGALSLVGVGLELINNGWETKSASFYTILTAGWLLGNSWHQFQKEDEALRKLHADNSEVRIQAIIFDSPNHKRE